MTETELERMVIRLMGDNDDYVEMLDEATKATDTATASIEGDLTDLEDQWASMESYFEAAGTHSAYLDSLAESMQEVQKNTDSAGNAIKGWRKWVEAIQDLNLGDKLDSITEAFADYDEQATKTIMTSLGLNESFAGFVAFLPTLITSVASLSSWLSILDTIEAAMIPLTWANVAAFWALLVPLLPIIIAAAALVAVLALVTYGLVSWWRSSTKASEEAEKLEEDIDKLNGSLQDEIEHMGKSAREIELYELKKRGATDAQLEQAKATMAAIDLAKAEVKADEERAKAVEDHRKAVDEATSAAEFNLAMIGKTKEEVQAAKLAQEGWTEAEIAHLQATEAAVAASKAYTAEQDKRQNGIDNYLKGLRDELAQMDMTATEREIAKAKLESLSSAEKAEIELLNETIAARKALTEAEKAHQAEVAKGQETVFKTIEGLQEQLATYGMSGKELALYKAQLEGADSVERERIGALWDELEARKAVTKAEQDAQKVTEQFMTPMEKYNKKLEDLAKIRDKLSDETYERAVKAAQEELDKAQNKGKLKTDVKIKVTIDTSAVRAGTKEFDDLLSGMQERALTALKARTTDADPANLAWPGATQPGGAAGAPPAAKPQSPPADSWVDGKGAQGEDSPVNLLKRIAEAAESLAERDGLLLTSLENG